MGDDHYGQTYRWYLIKNGVDRRCILVDKELSTGVALIELVPKGENRIIVSRGANGSLSEKDLKGLTQVSERRRRLYDPVGDPHTRCKNGIDNG